MTFDGKLGARVYEELRAHIGHGVSVVCYGRTGEEPANIALECRRCGCVVLKDYKPASTHYVTLMERVPFYGGPEEGGWWGEDHRIVAYQAFSTEEAAQAAFNGVQTLAAELSAEARTEFGKRCLRESAWLEARGLDDNFLPEPDGDSEFYVLMSEGLPEESHGSRHYE
jgi:hypothetical protein